MNQLFSSTNKNTSIGRQNPFINQWEGLSSAQLAVLFCKALKSPLCYAAVENNQRGVIFTRRRGYSLADYVSLI